MSLTQVGIASPNPDYPQEVKTVTGENTIDIIGKNIFHYTTKTDDGWYTDIPNMIKNTGTYTISINDTNLSGNWAVYFIDSSKTRIGDFIKSSSSVNTPSTFTATQEQLNAPYIRFLPNASGLHDLENYKIQIEKGTTASTYEEFKSQSYELNLGGTQLIDFSTPLSNSNTTNSFKQDILSVSTTSGTYANAYRDITTLYKNNPRKGFEI